MVNYLDLKKLVDVLGQQNDVASKEGMKTVGILLDEIIENYKQTSQAGIKAFMAKFYEELGEPVPEDDSKQLVVSGLKRIRKLFEEVNVLFEKNEFTCRFDFGEDAESEYNALTNQVKSLVSEMMKNGMDNYMNRRE